VQLIKKGELDQISHAIEALVSGCPRDMDENKSGVVTLLFRNSTMLSDNQFL